MKEIYSFNLTEKKELPIKEGQSAAEIKEIVYNIILKSPSREERDEIEIENAAWFGKFTARGALTKDMLLARYNDTTNGIFSQKEVNSLIKLYLSSQETKNELIKVNSLSENVDLVKKEELETKLITTYRQIQAMEQQHSDVFDMTAEKMAQKKVISHCVLTLTYFKKDGGEIKPFFEGETETDKYKWLDKREELKDNYIINNGLDRIVLYYHLWFMGAAAKKEDFEKIDQENAPK